MQEKPEGKEEKKKVKKVKKGKKDPTADRSIQSLYAELVNMKIVVPCPTTNASVADFVAIYNFNSSGGDPKQSKVTTMNKKNNNNKASKLYPKIF